MENLAELLQPLLLTKQGVYGKKHHPSMGTTQRERYGGLHPHGAYAEWYRYAGKLAATGECGQLSSVEQTTGSHDGDGKRHPPERRGYRSYLPRLQARFSKKCTRIGQVDAGRG